MLKNNARSVSTQKLISVPCILAYKPTPCMGCSFKAGVTNSHLSEGHIPRKKWHVGRNLLEKKLLLAAIYQRSSQNKLNLIKNICKNWFKFILMSVFEMFAGRTNASDGPHVARGPLVWDLWFKGYKFVISNWFDQINKYSMKVENVVITLE